MLKNLGTKMFEVEFKVTGHIDINDRAQIAVRGDDGDVEYGSRSIVEMTKEYCELFEVGDEGIITWDCKDPVENLQQELAAALAIVTRYVNKTNSQVDQ